MVFKFYTWYLRNDYSPYYIMWLDMTKGNSYYVFKHRDGKLSFSDGMASPSIVWDFNQVSGDPYSVKDPPLSIEDRHKMIKLLYEI